jgi:hypothetical protein
MTIFAPVLKKNKKMKYNFSQPNNNRLATLQVVKDNSLLCLFNGNFLQTSYLFLRERERERERDAQAYI